MPSFSKMSVWSIGYFKATASWLLQHRRDVAARVEVINAEIARIGMVTILYDQQTMPDGSVRTTENRVGMHVTPGTSLELLLQAYIAQGGNPFDISSFMMPDRSTLDADGNWIHEYPQGGIAAPQSADANSPNDEPGGTGYGGHTGGFVPLSGYMPGRQGGRLDRGRWEDDAIVKTMTYVRKWANQEIKALQNMEWRIVKLMDLREQLVQERDDVLKAAFGGALGVFDDSFDEDLYAKSHLVQNMIQDVFDTFYQEAPADGPDDVFNTRPDLGFFEFVVDDEVSEIRDPK